jgi:4-hydroxythreonine-4-phosphate dehydrogenase
MFSANAGPPGPIAITAGEPAGIGPEIVASALALRLAQGMPAQAVVVIGNRASLEHAARLVGAARVFDTVKVIDVPVGHAVVAGHLDVRNAAHVLAVLDVAIDGALAGRYAAIVTAPVHKGVIAGAGLPSAEHPFTGHTEYLADRCGIAQVVMLLTGEILPSAQARPVQMRVALATTHLALRDVPDAITREGLLHALGILDRDLRQRFGIELPRIAVCGLNPHAGESGHLGREEIDIISPAILEARAQGMMVTGPLPADTVFNLDQLARYDAVLAMYHDQGLPVLKHATFGHGVNITLGLPIVRTSVDHGTALDLAGTGRADAGSLLAALELAEQLVQ